MPIDTIDAIEIEAYIDGELDLARRLAVEDHLSRHPTLAARVMADFRTRSALQLLAGADFTPSPALAGTIAKVRKGSRPFWHLPAMGVAAVIAATLLTTAFLQISASPPSYVSLAAASHRSINDRVSVALQQPISTSEQELRLVSRIAVPRLPADWRVIDIELLDTAEVPAMLIAIRTTEGHSLSILALRKHSSAPREPDAVREGSQSVAYWRRGDFSYALTGEGDPQQIDATADALADSWRT